MLAGRSAISFAIGAEDEMALFVGLARRPALPFCGLQRYGVIRERLALMREDAAGHHGVFAIGAIGTTVTNQANGQQEKPSGNPTENRIHDLKPALKKDKRGKPWPPTVAKTQ